MKTFKLLLAAASLPALVGLAAPAYADSVDDGFLLALRTAGLSYGDQNKVITTGKYACELAEKGKPQPDIVMHVQELNPALEGDHAAQFTAIAFKAYCPQVLPGGHKTSSAPSSGSDH